MDNPRRRKSKTLISYIVSDKIQKYIFLKSKYLPTKLIIESRPTSLTTTKKTTEKYTDKKK